MDMNKIKTGIKRFFSNPNTLTFLLVIVLIVIIYVVYSYMINRAIAPVTVPYCTKEAMPLTEITDDYIGSVKISGNFVTANGSGLVQTTKNAKNKFVTPGYFIPSNSFFYSDALSDSSVQDTTVATDIPDGYTIYKLDVDFHKTYGCSIMTDNYIDIYIKIVDKDDDNLVIFDRLIKSIKVIKVVNKTGLDVFTEASDQEPKPTQLWFAVPDKFFELLGIAEMVKSNYSIEFFPVPRNSGYSENPEETNWGNEAIVEWLWSHASTKGGSTTN